MEKLLGGFIRIEKSLQIASLVGVATWGLYLGVTHLQNNPLASAPAATPTTRK
jgi:hypothetical protein